MNTVSKLPWLKGAGKPEASQKKLVSPFAAAESLKDLDDGEFEKLVHRIFIQRGYSIAEKREGAYDGVDLILQRSSESTYVQYQHWKLQQVDETDLGEFYVAMEVDGVKHGIVITLGEFSPDALDFSLGKSLMLINGIDLSQMIDALPTEIEENSNSEDQAEEKTESEQQMPELEPLCPICSQKMIKRTAKKGKNAGNTFWGCSQFPNCRGVVST